MKTTVGKRTKALRWIPVSLGILVILVLGFLALAPRLIHMESVRDRVVRLLSDKVGVEADLRKLELSYLPLPHIEVEHAKITLPRGGSGTLGSLSIYPRILPLLRGKAEISRIEVRSPELKIPLPKGKEDGPAGVPIHLALAPLVLGEPDLELEVSDGRLELVREGLPSISFRDIALEVVLPPEGLTFRVSCASTLWQGFSFNGHLDVQTFRGDGQVEVHGFQPQRLVESMIPENSLRLEDSMLDLGATVKMDGLRSLQAQIQGSLPEVTVIRKGRRTTIRAGRFTGSAGTGEEGIRFSLKELTLDKPRLGVTGELILGGGEKPVRMQLEGKEVDVVSLRETALSLAGDDPDVAGVFNVLRGGRAPTVTFQSEGRSLEELLDLDRMVIAGRMEEGRIFVPGADLDLQDVKGQAVIREGTLEGTDLEARYGNSTGRDGKMGLGLQGGNGPFHLDIELDADLAQVPPILKRFVENKAFLSELERIRDLKGSAKGKLVLGEETADIRARVEVHEFILTARHESFPYPIEVRGGHYFYEGTTSRVRDLRYRAGKSSVSSFSGSIEWKEIPAMEMEFRDARFCLEEVFPWLTAQPLVQGFLQHIRSLKGTLVLHRGHVKGPLHTPEKLRFQVSGEILDISGETKLHPWPVGLQRGKFEADQEKIQFQEVQAGILDTSLNVTGNLGPLRGLQKAELDFAGEIGVRTIEEFTRFSWRGRQVHVRSVLSLEPMHLTWDGEKSLALQGVASVRDGPSITLDIRREPGRWLINRILLQDKDSNADLSLRLTDREMTLSFSGKLNEATMDRIFPGYESQYGWVEGDFQVHLVQDRPQESWARGRVEADDFSVLHFLPQHVEIDRIALQAEQRRVEVETAVFVWAETRFSAGGSLEMKPEGLVVDLDFYSSILNWEQIKPYLPARGKKEPGKERKGAFDVPFRGEVRLHSDRLTAGGFTWSSLKAGALFSPKRVEARVTEAKVCGISTLGSVVVSPGGLSFRFDAMADDHDVLPSIDCLTQGKRKATGEFDLKAEIRGEGKEEELLRSLRGSVDFSAQKGRIQEHILFARILSFLNVTEILAGRVPDIGKEGIGYDRVSVKGEIRNGVFVPKEAVFDGVDMEIGFEGQVNLVDRTIDGRMLVAPFRTVDRIVKFIPLVRTILGGTLVSIPVKVSGPIDDPKLTPLDPSAVGAGLVNMMKRTFSLPVQIFNPLIHKQEKGG
ncbi:MAG: AsmA-like C-terminal domain-containing protein [Deltaproteobacteria bacterium]|nr:AsmA-like C-terminal domain-containing protein [Deltaproteobacteria bacterium]